MRLLGLLLLVPAVGLCADAPPEFVDQAKAYLTRNFNDPESAKYRDLYVTTDIDGKPVLCGEVNARNGRGGMSGYLAFFSKPGVDAAWAKAPREFLDKLPSAEPDYRLREKDRCKRPR